MAADRKGQMIEMPVFERSGEVGEERGEGGIGRLTSGRGRKALISASANHQS